jgi:hypothetical protein
MFGGSRRELLSLEREQSSPWWPLHFWDGVKNKHDWVLQPVIRYPTVDRLIEVLEDKVVRPAEAKFNELLTRRANKERLIRREARRIAINIARRPGGCTEATLLKQGSRRQKNSRSRRGRGGAGSPAEDRCWSSWRAGWRQPRGGTMSARQSLIPATTRIPPSPIPPAGGPFKPWHLLPGLSSEDRPARAGQLLAQMEKLGRVGRQTGVVLAGI